VRRAAAPEQGAYAACPFVVVMAQILAGPIPVSVSLVGGLKDRHGRVAHGEVSHGGVVRVRPSCAARGDRALRRMSMREPLRADVVVVEVLVATCVAGKK
jgi:hypothetical protein